MMLQMITLTMQSTRQLKIAAIPISGDKKYDRQMDQQD